jgi:ribosome-binding protein aMBF1 (putative translation factor)
MLYYRDASTGTQLTERKTMARAKDYAEVIRAKLRANPPLGAIEAESFNADIAGKVYEARNSAGLTQKQLANLVGTQQSVISRIEDADYSGHSLTLLKKIASALGKRLEVEFRDKNATPDIDSTRTRRRANIAW